MLEEANLHLWAHCIDILLGEGFAGQESERNRPTEMKHGLEMEIETITL